MPMQTLVSITGPYDRGMTTFAWRGREVAWQRTGSGPAVVLCHGTPFSSAIWRPFADALSSDHTVYVWDMPGYGASSKAAEHAVDLGVQGELLADLIAEWRLDQPDVIAHDFGGAVSLRAHLLHGARYRSLMLVDVVAIPPTGSPFFRFVQEHPGLLRELPAYIHEAIVTAYIRGASHRGLRADDLAALVSPWTDGRGPARLLSPDRADRGALPRGDPGAAGRDRHPGADRLGRARTSGSPPTPRAA